MKIKNLKGNLNLWPWVLHVSSWPIQPLSLIIFESILWYFFSFGCWHLKTQPDIYHQHIKDRIEALHKLIEWIAFSFTPVNWRMLQLVWDYFEPQSVTKQNLLTWRGSQTRCLDIWQGEDLLQIWGRDVPLHRGKDLDAADFQNNINNYGL